MLEFEQIHGTIRLGSGDGDYADLPPGVVIGNDGFALSVTNEALANDDLGEIVPGAVRTVAMLRAQERARREVIHQLRIAAAQDAAIHAEHRERTLLVEGNRAARRRAAKLNRKAAVQEAKRVLAFAKRTGRK